MRFSILMKISSIRSKILLFSCVRVIFLFGLDFILFRILAIIFLQIALFFSWRIFPSFSRKSRFWVVRSPIFSTFLGPK